MIKWADDLDVKNTLPEYPRPQMVRKEWMNLNGLWEFDSADMPSANSYKHNPRHNILSNVRISFIYTIGSHPDWY